MAADDASVDVVGSPAAVGLCAHDRGELVPAKGFQTSLNINFYLIQHARGRSINYIHIFIRYSIEII